MSVFQSLVSYFDLQSGEGRIRADSDLSAGTGSHFAAVWPQYLTVASGVVAEPFLRNYIAVGSWSVEFSQLGGRIVFGLIIAVMLLPAVYRAAFDPSKPIIVQLAALFPMGIGWQSIVHVGAKAVSG